MENYYDIQKKLFQDEQARKRLLEELNTRNPGSLPEDASERLSSVESPYDVHVSNTTVPMRGKIEMPPVEQPAEPNKLDYEIENDVVAPPISPSVSTNPVSASGKASDKKDLEAEAILSSSDNDNTRRLAELEALKKRNLPNKLASFGAGIGDAISASASAFGGNAPGGSQQRLIERQDKQLDTDKKDIESRIRNDSKSDISKQYQALVAQFLQKDPADPTILGLTANQIAEKIPQIEKLAALRQQEELKRLQIENTNAIKNQAASDKAEKTADDLWTPMGTAHTKNDAKILKDVFTSYTGTKSSLDSLLDLRKQKGAEFFDRGSVKAAETIAADLTVQYKELAKLGVLSGTDYALLERLVPTDPLQVDILGDTMAQLKQARKLIDQRIDSFSKGYGVESPVKGQAKSVNPGMGQRQTKSGISYSTEE